MNSLYKVYQEIAMERPHVCSGCGRRENLSHSHLIPKSYSQALKTEKKNLVYHCLSLGERVGCHDKWQSLDAWQLKDFEQNMLIIYELDKTYFWIKFYKIYNKYASLPEAAKVLNQLTEKVYGLWARDWESINVNFY